MQPTSTVQVQLLGGPTLNSGRETLALDRKTAALLAYLALNRDVTRSRLAGLLWPESPESSARNSLVQLIRRWRVKLDLQIADGGDVLQLAPELQVDVRQAQDARLLQRHGAFLAYSGILLGPCVLTDLPEFQEWLEQERQRWRDARRASLSALSDEHASRGDYAGALDRAQELLLLAPHAEDAFARVMKFQYLCGERTEALRTYQRAEAVLRDTYGVAPLPGTTDLLHHIISGRDVPVLPRRFASPLPHSVRTSPVLAGREREWERMEDAWSRGVGFVLSGDAGIGKTRLLREFVASRGPWFHLNGRPGDSAVPYATYAREWRTVLRNRACLPLPEWVRAPLSPFMPELRPGGPVADVLFDQEQVSAAMVELARLACQGIGCVVADDMQYYDPESMRLSAAVGKALVPGRQVPPLFSAHRRGQLPPWVERALRDSVDAGIGIWIDLAPLDRQATVQLISNLRTPLSQEQVLRVASTSDGNPLFVLEAVRHVLEQPADAASSSLPHRVQEVIRDRLAHLSPHALLLAQAAAIVQPEFDLDLLSDILEAPPLTMVPAWEELERSQVVSDGTFIHDLVYEAVLAGMSESVRQALHRSAAATLDRHGATPTRTARHWFAGGEWQRAAQVLQVAALQVAAADRHAEAADLSEQAAQLLEAHGDLDAAFLVWKDCLTRVPAGLPEWLFERAAPHLTRLARRPEQHAFIRQLDPVHAPR